MIDYKQPIEHAPNVPSPEAPAINPENISPPLSAQEVGSSTKTIITERPAEPAAALAIEAIKKEAVTSIQVKSATPESLIHNKVEPLILVTATQDLPKAIDTYNQIIRVAQSGQ